MFKWILKAIKTHADWVDMQREFLASTAKIGAFDTEATGLHHINDVPFLFQFGWVDLDRELGFAYAVDLELHKTLATLVIKTWHTFASRLDIYLGHHILFDLHMMTNIGMSYTGTNIGDTMIYIRLGSNAVQVEKGGAPLGLKDFATMFITKKAKEHESLLNEEKSKMTSVYNNRLKKALGWTKKQIDAFFKDATNEVVDLPKDKQAAYLGWKANLPLYLQEKVTGAVEKDMIRYDKLDRENVTTYGMWDIVWTIETYLMMEPIVVNRGNVEAVKFETEMIPHLYDMERAGFEIDKPYLYESKERVKRYIRERRADLVRLAGEPIKIGQRERILSLLDERFGITATATGKEEFDLLVSDLKRAGGNEDGIDFIETIQELRTLEKWYSTYILRFMYNLRNTSRLYTSINSVGAVTGRVTSDFQQFPKGAITTVGGEELFHPRKLVIVDKSEYQGIVYLDYSQIELRFQALYTILVGHPDLNLCRAYMPYKCHTSDGKPFDYEDHWCIDNAYTIPWFYDEDPDTEWVATDVHGATTKHAFNMDEHHPDFKKKRYEGKRVNFAKNYGAQYNKIKSMFPEYDEDQIRQIDEAYYKAFPGVKAYHNYCYSIANARPFAANLFGARYYGVPGHNLINTLVQGSAAYFLKMKIKEVNTYLKVSGYKSRMQMQIHDELSFEWHKDDSYELFFKLKQIMSDWDDAIVPVVADMEVTFTNWAEKIGIESEEEFEEAIRNGH